MISIASTLLLVALVFSSVPSTFAAPVGTRALDVATMRRMDATNAHVARREHHSARSVVPDDSNTIKIEKEKAPRVTRRHHAKNIAPRYVKDAVPRRARGLVPSSDISQPREEKGVIPTKVESKENVPRNTEAKKTVVPRTEDPKKDDCDKGNTVPTIAPNPDAPPTEQPATKRESGDGSIKPIATFRRALRESVKRDTGRGPIKPIAIFRRTLENLD